MTVCRIAGLAVQIWLSFARLHVFLLGIVSHADTCVEDTCVEIGSNAVPCPLSICVISMHVSICEWQQEVAAELGYSKIGLRAMAERVLGAQMPKSNSVRCRLMRTVCT